MDADLREFVRRRADSLCEYCRLPNASQLLPFHVEHIVARQHGGADDASNLAWSCARCNGYKGTNLASVDPKTGAVAALYHPRRDVWLEHFTIEEDEVCGSTPTGRATVQLLQMNSRRRIELRRELKDQGLVD